MPSAFSHEILNANPYAYLDDAPLEERRARAVEMRRVLPEAVAVGSRPARSRGHRRGARRCLARRARRRRTARRAAHARSRFPEIDGDAGARTVRLCARRLQRIAFRAGAAISTNLVAQRRATRAVGRRPRPIGSAPSEPKLSRRFSRRRNSSDRCPRLARPPPLARRCALRAASPAGWLTRARPPRAN